VLLGHLTGVIAQVFKTLIKTKSFKLANWIGFTLVTYTCEYAGQQNLYLNSETIRNFQTNKRTRTNFNDNSPMIWWIKT